MYWNDIDFLIKLLAEIYKEDEFWFTGNYVEEESLISENEEMLKL